MQKEIKINFCGFWTGFDPYDNYFINSIRDCYTVEVSDDPDYIFCSVFSNRFVYNENAVRIFYTGECQTPDFNLFDYAMGFDYLELGDRYCRLPLYLLYGSDLLDKAVNRDGMIDNPLYRDRFCSFVYSNPDGDPVREYFFRQLNARRRVDSGGKYLNNINERVKDKIGFEREHRFSVAFENYSYPGYVTEKVFESFAAGTVPIYWGDPEIDRTLNPDSYVNVRRYESIDKAVDRVLEIDEDPELYRKILSSPVFCDNKKDLIKKQKEASTDFLKSIFDRPKEDAFRRNRGLRGKNYEKFFKRYSGFDEKLRSIKNMLRS